jgi:hypothetical protein
MSPEIVKLTLLKLVESTPNDQELGDIVRQLYYKIKKYETTNSIKSEPTTISNAD